MSEKDHHAARERRQAEEADYATTMGEYLASIFEAEDRGKRDAAGSIFDAVGRARLAQEDK